MVIYFGKRVLLRFFLIRRLSLFLSLLSFTWQISLKFEMFFKFINFCTWNKKRITEDREGFSFAIIKCTCIVKYLREKYDRFKVTGKYSLFVTIIFSNSVKLDHGLQVDLIQTEFDEICEREREREREREKDRDGEKCLIRGIDDAQLATNN